MTMNAQAITFQNQGVHLKGAWFPAAGKTTGTVILQPGFASGMPHVQPVALQYQQMGFNVLSYDPRGFGESEGLPRQHIDPKTKLSDLLAAINFLIDVKHIDQSQLFLWGFSLGGGIVLAAAAETNHQIAGIICIAPFIDGRENAKFRDQDFKKLKRKNNQIVLTGDPNALFPDTSATDFYAMAPDWPQTVTALSILKTAGFSVQEQLQVITCPVTMVIAEDETINAPYTQTSAFETLNCPKNRIVELGDHFTLCRLSPSLIDGYK